MLIREIQQKDDKALFKLIRLCLEDAKLNIPGTAYFDESIKHMSEYYLNHQGRKYYVIVDQNDNLLGGCGFAEFGTYTKDLSKLGNDISIAELQKLYIDKNVRGQGFSYKLVELIEAESAKAGYKKLYLETHHNLPIAIELYKKMNYTLLKTPLEGSLHSTMDYFFIKDL